jgi:cyclomaltodextrinase / maltogenic alpha-amylase / neopullulanase
MMRHLVPPLVVLLAAAACRQAQSPVAPPPEPPAEDAFTFSYTPPAGAPAITSITVPGSFNGWSTSVLSMVRRADGSWAVSTELEEGRHEYKFFINGQWPVDMCDDRTWGDPRNGFWIDPDAEECVPDGNQGRNAVIDLEPAGLPAGVGFQHDPRNAAHLSVAGGRLSIRFRVNPQEVRSASVSIGGPSVPMHHQLSYRTHEVWRASVPEGTASYSLALETAGGTEVFGPFTVPGTLFRTVPWVGGAVGYQIFPERFWNGDPSNDHHTVETDAHAYMHPAQRGSPPVLMPTWGGEVMQFHCCHQYFGGDIQGIIDRLDHLEALGVSLLYLNPVFLAGSAHGYDTFDYLVVAPNFGDERVLRTLLDRARARGIRMMWDFVPNHVGVGHHAFQDAVQRGQASPYWSWFRFHVPAAQVEVGNGRHYDAWSGFGSLPKLDTRNPAVFQHLLDVTRHWTEFGFDGIRVDVPNDILNRKEFFQAFRRTAKGINPDAYLVGEIWQRSPGWVQGDEFDSLMNYAIGQSVIERFATGELRGSAAAQEMAQLYAEYPEASVAMQFNLISSHDTGRLLTKMGGGPLGAAPGSDALARHRLASAMLYALPGMPVTFQGDECAFLGTGAGPREENRYPMQWQDCDSEMVAHYRQLAVLKRELSALASPSIRTIRGEGSVISFLRGEPGAGEVLAIFNSGATAQTLLLPAGDWTDAASGQLLSGDGAVGPFGWRYLLRH